jgi:hypothetical protein
MGCCVSDGAVHVHVHKERAWGIKLHQNAFKPNRENNLPANEYPVPIYLD